MKNKNQSVVLYKVYLLALLAVLLMSFAASVAAGADGVAEGEKMPVSLNQAKGPTDAADEAILSDRELAVLRLLAAGDSYKEIGENLFLNSQYDSVSRQGHLPQTLGQQEDASSRESQGDEFDLTTTAQLHIRRSRYHMFMWFFLLTPVLKCRQ